MPLLRRNKKLRVRDSKERFGSSLNLNIHFHMLFLEGVITTKQRKAKFNRVKAPTHSDMEYLVHTVSHRIAVGPDMGKKVFTLQTLPAKDDAHYGQLAQIDGLSLHTGVFDCFQVCEQFL